ncbi:MAG: hypothetical protein JXR37_09570 [Kiritimatiellae bacterium]|nr:hypothetical protein [Kiritimatiellia bacterium]
MSRRGGLWASIPAPAVAAVPALPGPALSLHPVPAWRPPGQPIDFAHLRAGDETRERGEARTRGRYIFLWILFLLFLCTFGLAVYRFGLVSSSQKSGREIAPADRLLSPFPF